MENFAIWEEEETFDDGRVTGKVERWAGVGGDGREEGEGGGYDGFPSRWEVGRAVEGGVRTLMKA